MNQQRCRMFRVKAGFGLTWVPCVGSWSIMPPSGFYFFLLLLLIITNSLASDCFWCHVTVILVRCPHSSQFLYLLFLVLRPNCLVIDRLFILFFRLYSITKNDLSLLCEAFMSSKKIPYQTSFCENIRTVHTNTDFNRLHILVFLLFRNICSSVLFFFLWILRFLFWFCF